MDNDTIISLCVSVINNNGHARLFRIADIVEDAKILPYSVDHSYPLEGTNTSYIFNPNIPAEGSLNVWEWHLDSWDGRERQRSYIRNNYRWIEYLRFDGISTLEELRIALFNGINFEISPDHDYLLEYAKSGENTRMCVYCTSSNFRQTSAGFVLCDDIYSLENYEISLDEVGEIKIALLPKYFKRYYLSLNLPQYQGKVLVRTPADTIKQAIKKRINRCTEAFSKENRQIIRSFLQNLSSDTVIEHIMAECKCSTDEALEGIADFRNECEKYFSEDDFAKEVLLHLIEFNSEIGSKYREAVKEEWERQNADKINNANDALKDILDSIEYQREKSYSESSKVEEKLKGLLSECEEAEIVKSEIQHKITELQNGYDAKLKMANEISVQIRTRIEVAKKDMAIFLAEYAIYGAGSFDSPQQSVKNKLTAGIFVNETPETITNIDEIFDVLQDNLEIIGVEQSLCPSLGAYLLSAYMTKTPLIVAGYGACDIIDALSATICNKTADKLFINDVSTEYNLPTSGIVAVYNAFGCMDRLSLKKTEAYICFVSQSSEELALEPRSMYNYTLPIFAEYFINADHTDELYGAISEIQYDVENKEKKSLLPAYLLPPLAINRFKSLAGVTGQICKSLSNFHLLLLQVLPIMLSLGKRDELLELISTVNLSDKEKEKVYELIGER